MQRARVWKEKVELNLGVLSDVAIALPLLTLLLLLLYQDFYTQLLFILTFS